VQKIQYLQTLDPRAYRDVRHEAHPMRARRTAIAMMFVIFVLNSTIVTRTVRAQGCPAVKRSVRIAMHGIG